MDFHITVDVCPLQVAKCKIATIFVGEVIIIVIQGRSMSPNPLAIAVQNAHLKLACALCNFYLERNIMPRYILPIAKRYGIWLLSGIYILARCTTWANSLTEPFGNPLEENYHV